MIFKKPTTDKEREKVDTIPAQKFSEIGHKSDDYELDYDSFMEHYRQVKEYLDG